MSDKIVNSAEGTNLLIEEGPQTMKTEIVKKIDLQVFFKYHEIWVKKKIFVKYHIAAPRKKDLCKLVRKIFTESSLSPLEIFRQSPLSIALIVLHTLAPIQRKD